MINPPDIEINIEYILRDLFNRGVAQGHTYKTFSGLSTMRQMNETKILEQVRAIIKLFEDGD